MYGDGVMYGVYLVDGNAGAISEMKRGIPWGANGFRVIGSSVDPNLAISEIITTNPHVVIFDRESAGIDPQQFMNEVHKANADCKIVMLTTTYTFSAARSFFLRGGFDYLLKPLDKDMAEEVLKRFVRKRRSAK